jgi:hypothetical protein
VNRIDYRAVGATVGVLDYGVASGPSRLETHGLFELMQRMGVAPQQISSIAQQTVNRAAARTKTRVARAVRDEVNLKYREALDKVTATKAYFAGGVTQAKVFAQKRGLMLTRYARNEDRAADPQASRPRPKVGVGRSRGVKQMDYSFYVRLKNGALAIASRPKGEKRKFEVLHGPSPSQIFDSYRPRIAAEIRGWVNTEMIRRIRYVTDGRGEKFSRFGLIEQE